jgi:hypothetical protein
VSHSSTFYFTFHSSYSFNAAISFVNIHSWLNPYIGLKFLRRFVLCSQYLIYFMFFVLLYPLHYAICITLLFVCCFCPSLIVMQEHRSLIKRASTWSRKDSWTAPTNFEMLWKLLRRSLMKSFIKKRTCIVKGTLSL